MKKTLPIMVVGILVLSGLGAVALPSEQPVILEQTTAVSFSTQPVLKEKGEFVDVTFEGANALKMQDGYPILPYYKETFVLPKDATKVEVTCDLGDIHTMDITGEITPAKTYRIGLDNPDDVVLTKDTAVYASAELYPDTWFDYRVGRGLHGTEQVVYVNAIVHTVRYSPAENTLTYVDGADITVSYQLKDPQQSSSDEFDLVIIVPQKLASTYQKLVDHKTDMGVATMVKTVEEIYDEYDGFDPPEEVKLFIKDAHETTGAMYFLLGAGLNSRINADDKDDRNQGSTDWYVPVRYTNIPEDDGHGVISDLYYADIYDGEGNFSSWDSNGDGVYAVMGIFGLDNDELDLYPDVFVGRLAVRNKMEARIIINKIVKYESTTPASKSWFTSMIGVAGRTFEIYQGQPDGEYVCDTSFDYMGDLIDNEIKCYASNQDGGGYTPVPNDIISAFKEGAGYVDFQGHGNPISWNTHWETGDDWTGGINIYLFWKLFNFKQLPVIIVGGCHNALFNVSLMKTMDKDLPQHWYWTYGQPCPVSFSFAFLIIPWGGGIASTGCTGYGIGYVGMPLSLSAEMESNFFYSIGQEGAQTPAEAHAGSITKYLNDNPDWQQTDAFCITEFQLFADPSMVLGGYE